MVPELKPIAGKLGQQPEYAKAAAYVTGLDLLPLRRRPVGVAPATVGAGSR